MRSHKFLTLARLGLAALSLVYVSMPLSAQERDGDAKDKHEAEHDDPRARALYLEQMRTGGQPQPPAARLKAMEQRDEAVREEGRLFRQKMQASQASKEEYVQGMSTSTTQWINIGPRPTIISNGTATSGRVAAIAVDPTDSTGNTAYAGAAQGGVWKTTNGGTNWTPLTDSQASLATGSITVASDGTVYVGTGEQSFSSDSYYGAGVLKSSDGGTSWTRLGANPFANKDCSSPPTSLGCGGYRIGGIAVRPGTSGSTREILAATQQAFSNTGGIYRSANDGSTWSLVLSVSNPATAVAFADANVAYAGVYSQGVWKSVNGGATWAAANGTGSTITTTGTERVEIAVFDANVVFAALTASDGSLAGLYKTTDGGQNWAKLTITDYCNPQCWYDTVVAVNPTNSNVVFVGGSAVSGYLQKSVDGGATWTSAPGPHVDQHAMAFSANGAKLYLGNDGGVWSTTDTGTGTPGASWTNLNTDLAITQFYTYFSIHPNNVDITFGGAQDNGTQKYTGTNSLATAWANVTCGDGAGAFVNPDGNQIYANCQNTDIRKSTTGGGLGSFSTFETGLSQTDNPNFIPPMAGDPNNPDRIYFGATSIWRNFNDGGNWQAIAGTALTSPQQWNNFAFASNGDLYGAGDTGSIFQIATPTSPVVADITGTGGPGFRVNGIAVAPGNGTVYIGAAGFSASQKVYRAVPNGTSTTWTNITGTGLPNTPINDLVADQSIANTLYAATDVGVYRTQNADVASPTWTLLGTGLPNVAVFGIKLHQSSRTLRAATHGRGFWDLSVPSSVVGPGMFVSPTTMTFGNQAVGTTSAAQTVNINNNGNQTTTISSASISNNPAEFGILSNNCPASLAANQSCALTVVFTPNGAGTRTGTLTITSNAANSPVLISLSGTGLQRPANDDFVNAQVLTGTLNATIDTRAATKEATDPLPDFTCAGGAFFTNNNTIWYKFTPTGNGTISADTTNSGYDTVLSVWTQNSGARRSQFVQFACNDDINPGIVQQSQLTNVAVTGGTTYYIMVSSYDPGGGSATKFNFSSTVSGVAGSLSLTPSPVNINAIVGRPLGLVPVTFKNSTGSSTTVNGVSVDGGFTQSNNCGVLADGASCTINIGRSGDVSGNATGTLTVTGTFGVQNATVNLTAVSVLLAKSTRSVRPLRGAGPIAAGETAQFDVSVNVGGGAVASPEVISLTCSGVPKGASCSIEPSSVPLTSGVKNVVVNVKTAAGAPRASRLGGAGGTASGTYNVRVNAAVGSAVTSLDLPLQVTNEPAAPAAPRGPRGLQKR